jgi:hypothetical protein
MSDQEDPSRSLPAELGEPFDAAGAEPAVEALPPAFDPFGALEVAPAFDAAAPATVPGPSAWARAGQEVVAGLKTLVSAAVYATLIVTFGFQVARVDGLSMAPRSRITIASSSTSSSTRSASRVPAIS